jgi:2-dehydro-3-deoxyphosphogluconate aldolase/(4S)-4-hydroxy-2-oxoglutarate aldolase
MPAVELSARMRALCERARVIPAVTLERAEDAVPLARALAAGGLTVIEIMLRSTAAIEAIRAAVARVPQATVGAGTLLTAADVAAAKAAGARFGVSPGAMPALLAAAEAAGLPLLPGAATASEAMALAERGWTMLKFFPAEAMGGTATLGALAGPLPRIGWCPTGGITRANVASYRRLSNVICTGGSWPAPREAIAARDWARIEALAREAAAR